MGIRWACIIATDQIDGSNTDCPRGRISPPMVTFRAERRTPRRSSWSACKILQVEDIDSGGGGNTRQVRQDMATQEAAWSWCDEDHYGCTGEEETLQTWRSRRLAMGRTGGE
jgi:hypothetical protein